MLLKFRLRFAHYYVWSRVSHAAGLIADSDPEFCLQQWKHLSFWSAVYGYYDLWMENYSLSSCILSLEL